MRATSIYTTDTIYTMHFPLYTYTSSIAISPVSDRPIIASTTNWKKYKQKLMIKIQNLQKQNLQEMI